MKIILFICNYCRNLKKNEKVHGHYDNHWNADGHKFASEFIYIKLIEEQLVPIEGEK